MNSSPASDEYLRKVYCLHPDIAKMIGIDGGADDDDNAQFVKVQPDFQYDHLKVLTQPGRMRYHHWVSRMKVAPADHVLSEGACSRLAMFTSAHGLRRSKVLGHIIC